MFKELKETMAKDMNKNDVSQNRDYQLRQKLQKGNKQILELRSTITDKHFIRGAQWVSTHDQAGKKSANLKTGPLKLTYLRARKKNEEK